MKLGRYGLSEVINHLLGTTSQPFDFLIQEKLLRVSLKKFISNHNVSTEAILTIEYFPALSFSDNQSTTELPAWIGCVNASAMSGYVVAGCYDGKVTFSKSSNLQVVSTFEAHSEPVRAIEVWDGHMATASKDCTLKIWSVTEEEVETDKKKKGKKSKEATGGEREKLVRVSELKCLEGHSNSVESLALRPGLSRGGEGRGAGLVAGDWAGHILAWSLPHRGTEEEEEEAGKSKKRKDIDGSGSGSKPLFSLNSHSQCVTSLQFSPSSPTSSSSFLFSGSWDRSVVGWDLERQDRVWAIVSPKVVTSLSLLPSSSSSSPSLLSSHSDGKIRLWDPRVGKGAREEGEEGEGCQGVYSPKDPQWVSQVRWGSPSLSFSSPSSSSSPLFTSVDLGGQVRVWDLRSASVSLGVREAHEGKGLCVDWVGRGGEGEGSGVVSGGSDCLLSLSQFS